MDLGSAAGTWINYEQLTRDSRPLAHGDLLHIGRLAFRFELATPPNRRPVVSPFEEDEP
jgi:predicted component of type VI protein secretion system